MHPLPNAAQIHYEFGFGNGAQTCECAWVGLVLCTPAAFLPHLAPQPLQTSPVRKLARHRHGINTGHLGPASSNTIATLFCSTPTAIFYNQAMRAAPPSTPCCGLKVVGLRSVFAIDFRGGRCVCVGRWDCIRRIMVVRMASAPQNNVGCPPAPGLRIAPAVFTTWIGEGVCVCARERLYNDSNWA